MDLVACGEQWRQRFRLLEWAVRIVPVAHEYVSEEQRSTAENIAYSDCLQARINVATGLPQAPRPEAEVDADLAHEMAHIALAELVDVARTIAAQLPADARPLAEEWLRGAEERAVRRLEAALAQ